VLVGLGANVNDQSNNDKVTPLHYAAAEGHAETVSVLVSYFVTITLAISSHSLSLSTIDLPSIR
jgi:ankyrin repeat protein